MSCADAVEVPSGAKLWNEFPRGLRVLAVDDDQLTLKIVEKMLRGCNYSVTTAVCGKDAIEILRERVREMPILLLSPLRWSCVL